MNDNPTVERLSCGDHLLVSYWTEPEEYRLGFVVEYSKSLARFELALVIGTWNLSLCFTSSHKQSKESYL